MESVRGHGMAAALKRSSHIRRLRCESHESRVVPAAQAIGFGAEFTADKLPGGLAAGHAAGNVLRTNGPHQARAAWAPSPVDVRWFETSFVFQPGEDDPAANGAKGD